MLQRADGHSRGRPGARPSCPGLDRVLWLRVQVRDGRPCDGVVHGVRHRRPVDLAVPAEVVRRLIATGVPTIATRANG